MAILSSKFDIVSVDNVISPAALAQVLTVGTLMPAPSVNSSGTPVAGTIPAGAIVMMSSTGKAELATSPALNAAASKIMFVTIDGDMDYSGAFVHRISVLAGGLTFKTDQYLAGAYTPGDELYADAGILKKKVWNDNNQRVGYVGPNGVDSVNGVLEVIMPQGLV